MTYGEQQDDVRLSERRAYAGINTKAIPAPAITDGGMQLHDLVQGGEVKTDTSTLSLGLTVPQAAVLRTEEGYVAPSVLGQKRIPGADALSGTPPGTTRERKAPPKRPTMIFTPGWIPVPTCSAGSFATAVPGANPPAVTAAGRITPATFAARWRH